MDSPDIVTALISGLLGVGGGSGAVFWAARTFIERMFKKYDDQTTELKEAQKKEIEKLTDRINEIDDVRKCEQHAEKCKSCELLISEKASRTRVLELEKRIEGIEKVGMNQLFLDNLRQTLASIEKKLDDNGRFIGRVEEALKKIDTVEHKIERHMDHHFDKEGGK